MPTKTHIGFRSRVRQVPRAEIIHVAILAFFVWAGDLVHGRPCTRRVLVHQMHLAHPTIPCAQCNGVAVHTPLRGVIPGHRLIRSGEIPPRCGAFEDPDPKVLGPENPEAAAQVDTSVTYRDSARSQHRDSAAR